MDFHIVLYLSIFRKSLQKIQVLLKSENNNVHCTWRRLNNYINIAVKFLGTKVPSTLGWPYAGGTWLYCEYFILCICCIVIVLTCFAMCGCVYVWVFWKLYWCFRNMCTCIYRVLYSLYCVCVLYLLCIISLICFVCTIVKTTATE
jgi:hypothetical protein